MRSFKALIFCCDSSRMRLTSARAVSPWRLISSVLSLTSLSCSRSEPRSASRASICSSFSASLARCRSSISSYRRFVSNSSVICEKSAGDGDISPSLNLSSMVGNIARSLSDRSSGSLEAWVA